jgi:hypothetical protein
MSVLSLSGASIPSPYQSIVRVKAMMTRDPAPWVLGKNPLRQMSGSDGVCHRVRAVRPQDTEKVLAGAAETLELSRPVAVNALMVLQYIPDGDGPWGSSGTCSSRSRRAAT